MILNSSLDYNFKIMKFNNQHLIWLQPKLGGLNFNEIYAGETIKEAKIFIKTKFKNDLKLQKKLEKKLIKKSLVFFDILNLISWERTKKCENSKTETKTKKKIFTTKKNRTLTFL